MTDQPKGLVVRDAHFPGRAPLDAYGDGGFRFADMSHRGSLLCLPSGIYGWDVTTLEAMAPGAFDRVVAEAAAIEVLFIGTGDDLAPPPEAVRRFLRENDVRMEFMATGAAVRTFNVLLGDARAVAGAFLAVD
ncbi:MAG: hypothetical protein C0606_01895 [Hyphomicrobiales bacterium]|nr:MAG: hypothetical protein C0606_01895 [Hyphomicrobiales bacterium]